MPRTKPTFAATIDVGSVHNTTCHRVRLMGETLGMLSTIMECSVSIFLDNQV